MARNSASQAPCRNVWKLVFNTSSRQVHSPTSLAISCACQASPWVALRFFGGFLGFVSDPASLRSPQTACIMDFSPSLDAGARRRLQVTAQRSACQARDRPPCSRHPRPCLSPRRCPFTALSLDGCCKFRVSNKFRIQGMHTPAHPPCLPAPSRSRPITSGSTAGVSSLGFSSIPHPGARTLTETPFIFLTDLQVVQSKTCDAPGARLTHVSGSAVTNHAVHTAAACSVKGFRTLVVS